jgi:hypothetical protein
VNPSHTPLTTRLRRRTAAIVAVALTAVLPLAVPNAPSAQANDRTAAAASSGYWMVASDGGIFSFGDAKFFGSTGNIKLNQPIVGIAATPTGNGYWMVATDGGIFSFGDAKFFGSTGNVKLNKPIVGMTSSPTGKGYWFVASDGGIFAFGDAAFYGSTGNIKLAKPITAMAATPSGKGYWFTASDGGVFNYGDAKFFGAAPSRPAPAGGRTVAAMVPTPDGAGYWQASATGELLAFGSAGDLGGLSGALARPIVGMTAVPATAVGVPGGPNPTQPPGNTTTTITTTPTTLPPYGGPQAFSSTALLSYGTPRDMTRTRTSSSTGEDMHPYSQKVSAVTEVGNRIYIGGEFTDLAKDDREKTPAGMNRAYIAELDTNGYPVPGSSFNATVQLGGPVRALLRSPDGQRIYVGGEFSHVNGNTNRARLVALNPATGAVDESFNPPTPSAYVSALALYGNALYIGGGFTTLGGDTTHPELARLNADNGALDTSFTPPPRYIGKYMTHTGRPVHDPAGTDPVYPDHATLTDPADPDPNGTVDALAVTADGKYLMVGGSFLHFGTPYDPTQSQSANEKAGGLIAVDPATGALTTWQPENGRPVNGLTVWPGDGGKTVFAAAGGAGGRLITFLPGGKSKTYLWRGNVDGDMMAVAATNEWVYVVGHFDYEVNNPDAKCLNVPQPSGGYSCKPDPNAPPQPADLTPKPHRHLVSFDARGERDASGKVTKRSSVDPFFTAQADTSEGPYTVHIGANRMYVGGNFYNVASTPTSTGGERIKQPGLAVYPPR